MANTRAQKTAQNLSTLTTAGDIAYASAAGVPARLGIGSSAQVLTVAAGVPSWATASSGALTKITSASFTAVANTGTTFDGVFTSTYKNYVIKFSGWGQGGDLSFNFKTGTSTTFSSANYYGGRYGIFYTGANATAQTNGATAFKPTTIPTSGEDSQMTMNIYDVGNSASNAAFDSTSVSGSDIGVFIAGGIIYNTTITATGFIFTPVSGNLSGTCAVYGVQN